MNGDRRQANLGYFSFQSLQIVLMDTKAILHLRRSQTPKGLLQFRHLRYSATKAQSACPDERATMEIDLLRGEAEIGTNAMGNIILDVVSCYRTVRTAGAA